MDQVIKFIYFDVGGVAILDFSKTNKWVEMAEGLGVTEDAREKFYEIFAQYENDICINKNTLEAFLDEIKSKLKLSIHDNYSMLDDFVNRFEMNTSIIPVIEKIFQHYKVGLLTNMYPEMLDRIVARNILPNIEWDVVIDSSIEGVAKPQPEIYELAEKASGFSGQEILFVENSERHIEAAQKFDWQTFLYDPSDVQSSNRKLLTKIGI